MNPILLDFPSQINTDNMTEAVQGICEYAFNELKARRLEIRCDTLNNKSKAIPERLGFLLEGTLRFEDTSVDGEKLTDTYIYAKTN